MSLKLLIGISVGLCSTVLSSFGIALQRKSHLLLAPTQGFWSTSTGQLLNRHLWGVGFIIYLLSAITGSIFSIGSLPVTLLAPIGAFSLVCNALFARLLLKDTWSWQAGVGTLIILLGATVVGIFGSLPESERSLDDLLVLYSRPQFILYFAIQNVFIIIFMVWNAFNAQRIDAATQSKSFGRDKLPFSNLTLPVNRTIVGLIYGALSNLIATQGILFAKSGIELLSLTIGGRDQFDRPLAWVVVGMLILTALVQLYYLNRAVAFCDIVLLMPCNYCVYNVSCLLNGLVYYNQWSLLEWWKLLLVLIGTLVLTVGVIVLSLRPQAPAIVNFSPLATDAELACLVSGDTTPPCTESLCRELAQPPPTCLKRHVGSTKVLLF
ncbi:hypothetical protein DSO57_1022985 [Entomophthora muscae]|uniref:Uncharacterized protein n=1 Tax=Entomophthora muscae TaxID=34485 RepID=A0ACC2T368_9FUNG|nr:hypothetical protein DSO57_1022985 [Entomophthora muscae]